MKTRTINIKMINNEEILMTNTIMKLTKSTVIMTIIIMVIIVKVQNICNLIGWNSVHISDIFNCYRANINGMWNAGKLGGIYTTFKFTLT